MIAKQRISSIKILLFLLLPLYGFPQPIAEKIISVENIGISKGLSQGMINCIWQDHYGFMWFGTMDGLNRYDGYKFQVYRHDLFDSTSVSGNFITSIFEDSKGRLWIGTALNGLNLFNRENEQFVHFSINTRPALSNNTVLSIQEDKHGAIWIGTQSGLNKLTVGNNFDKINTAISFSIKRLQLTDTAGNELFTTRFAEPSFLVTKSGTIWVSASQLIFKIIFAQSGEEKIFKHTIPLHINRQKVSKLNNIIKITEDTTRGLLCFKGQDFFTIFWPKTGKYSHWDCAPFDLNMYRNQVLWDDELLWERTSNGLFCFDPVQKKMYRVRSNNAEYDKLLQTPFGIYKDRSGIIWIGTGGFGLLKYNPHTKYFHKIATGSVSWMSATRAGNVWMTNREMRYDAKASSANEPVYISDTTFKVELLRYAKKLADVGLQDKEGTYWLNIDGVVKFSPAKKSLQFLKKIDDILFPYFLDKDDRLWFATSNSFCLLNKKTNRVTSYPFPGATAGTSLYRFCQVIYQDAKGIFWLGTVEGLFSFNEKTQQWKRYHNKSGERTSISGNIIFSICDDPEKPGVYLWVGTNGGGLNRLSINTGRFEHIGIEEGLPSLVVYGILADYDKQLWISTNNGIACLKPQYRNTTESEPPEFTHIKFKYYYEENGLQSNEFNRYAYCKTKYGILFFGGVNGFNYFNPRQVIGNTVVPEVVITDMRLHNKPVSLSVDAQTKQEKQKRVLSKPLYLTDSVELAYEDNMVSFDFAALDFTAPEKNLYQYKMEGFDKEWILSGHNHSATYTNLDPGMYTFYVKGSNNDGVWNENATALHLTILAPWYMTWWFRTLIIAAIVALLYVLFQYRLQQKIKLFNIRNDIASDLHDEIGSTLSSVYIYSEVAQKDAVNLHPQTHSYLKLIGVEAANMIDALSDIVWSVNAENDRFENIINRMRAAAIEVFEAKGYQLHLEFDEKFSSLKLGMAKRKNFYLIYKEAINNASKYSDGKNIWIILAFRKPYINLSVKDDGKGFGPGQKRSGNGLANMQKRSVQLNGKLKIISSPGSGTLVHLDFPV